MSINDVPHFLVIFDLPTYLVLLYNVPFLGIFYLSNNRGGWNKRGGSAKVAKSINVEGGIFWKKLVHKCNKRGVEGGKNLRNQ